MNAQITCRMLILGGLCLGGPARARTPAQDVTAQLGAQVLKGRDPRATRL
jgi:hypothetical protein